MKHSILSRLIIVASVIATLACPINAGNTKPSIGIDEVFRQFRNPPAEARPFVRWWWNGDQVEEAEIVRELDVLKKAGFGGLEINPIAKPPGPASKAPVLTWRSKEWDLKLHVACKAAKERGLIVDLIAGSGWPFGGEFLKPEQQIMRVTVLHEEVKGPVKFRKPVKDILASLYMGGHGKRKRRTKFIKPSLEFVTLLPTTLTSVKQIVEVPKATDGVVEVDIPAGKHIVAYGIRETGYRKVMNGAKGAAGPTMDHYNRAVTRAYLNRLKGVEETWGEPMSTYVHAIFCDSIETAAANWTHDILASFKERKGYDIKPYLPLVMKRTHVKVATGEALQDELRRARYDWNEHLVTEFLKHFTSEFHAFCRDNKLLSRYQAYGTPYLMGMAEGYTIPDIPESNNWLYSGFSKGGDPAREACFNHSYSHGYMCWTKYTSAGGHIRNRRVISTEAMTNTRRIFHTTLGTIKQADDMNFITGINHSVLHGFNYSPPDVPFPGWIRYGTYFSEHNTWWPYLKLWADYNARLSAVFQSTAPVAEVALIGPTPDLWSSVGLDRAPFHLEPAYFHKLWEPIGQLGGNCDYLHGAAIQEAKTADGLLRIGPMAYKVLIVAEMESMLPKTAAKIQELAAAGGKVIYVKSPPRRSPGLMNAADNDRRVRDAVKASLQKGAKLIQPPAAKGDLRTWTMKALSSVGYQLPLRIQNPRNGLYHLRHKAADEDVLFFTNTYRQEPSKSRVSFKLGDRGLWRWDPETGKRTPYALPYDSTGFQINLRPLESVLLVTGKKEVATPALVKITAEHTVKGPWEVGFQPAQSGKSFTMKMDTLKDFTKSNDKRLAAFSGTASYQATVDLRAPQYTHIELGDDNDFISEIWLNNKKIGVNWYGKQRFDIRGHLQNGKNSLVIKYTTTLNNLMRTRNARYKPKAIQPSGLVGPVRLLKLE